MLPVGSHPPVENLQAFSQLLLRLDFEEESEDPFLISELIRSKIRFLWSIDEGLCSGHLAFNWLLKT